MLFKMAGDGHQKVQSRGINHLGCAQVEIKGPPRRIGSLVVADNVKDAAAYKLNVGAEDVTSDHQPDAFAGTFDAYLG